MPQAYYQGYDRIAELQYEIQCLGEGTYSLTQTNRLKVERCYAEIAKIRKEISKANDGLRSTGAFQ